MLFVCKSVLSQKTEKWSFPDWITNLMTFAVISLFCASIVDSIFDIDTLVSESESSQKAESVVESTPQPTPRPTSAIYRVTASFDMDYNDHVGNDWSYYASVNGVRIKDGGSTITCKAGKPITVYAKCVEDDTYPDVGENTYEFTPPASYIGDTFYASVGVVVTEDRGRYAGNTAKFIVQFDFNPEE